MANRIEVGVSKKKYEVLGGDIKKTGKLVLEFLKKKNLSVEVFLVDEGEIRRINRESRGKDEVTNVLSFTEVRAPIFVEPKVFKKNHKSLGEVYLSPDYIFKNKQDLNRMFVHGLLHLLGYDHTGKSDTIMMTKLENKICEKILLSV